MLNTRCFEVLGFFSLLVVSHVVSSISSTEEPTASLDHGLVDWLNSRGNGGYFNPKQEIRLADPTNPKNSMRGVFAKERIEEGEVLCHVPWDSILSSEEPDGEEWERKTNLSCGTVRNLVRQFDLGDKSNIAPYVSYLKAQAPGQIPSAWSKGGRYLWGEVVGGYEDADLTIPPFGSLDWLDSSWFYECGGDPSDTLSAHAAMLVVQRADEDVLVPLYDMYNHRNGDWLNTIAIRIHGEHHETKASRTIKAGEEIYNSYNLCYQCGERYHQFGTPEIFRDYGFVESMPQRWNFLGEHHLIVLDEDGYGAITANFLEDDVQRSPQWRDVAFLFFRGELERLRMVRNRIWNLEYNMCETIVPKKEWDLIWQYHQAVVVAMSHSIDLLGVPKMDNDHLMNEKSAVLDGPCTVMGSSCDHYFNLSLAHDDGIYTSKTCNTLEADKYLNYEEFERSESFDRAIVVKEDDHGDENVCMFLDAKLQVCSKSMVHSNEHFVHFPAQYLGNVQRVLLVGSGNPMPLEESLKYPNLELVVALARDQLVTRKLQEHFDVSAEFDDDRVEWWFGDIATSVSLLSSEYLTAFDMILVEETERSPSLLTKLSCLLKPQGVLATNGRAMEEMSQHFEYTTQIFHECPTLCMQALVFGSNQIDFLHHPTFEHHSLETDQFEPLEEYETRFGWLHDYQKNARQSETLCESLDELNETEEETFQSFGFVHVFEAADPAPFTEPIKDLLRSALQSEGLSVVATHQINEGILAVITQDGYILARAFPGQGFYGFDFFRWGHQKSSQRIHDALYGAFGKDNSVSSWRIVLGNTTKARSDGELIEKGCESNEASIDGAHLDLQILQPLLSTIVDLFEDSPVNVAVFCGGKNTDLCHSFASLSDHQKTDQVIPIWTCSSLENAGRDGSTDARILHDCEKELLASLLVAFEDSGVDLLVIDSSAPPVMLQILDSILSSTFNDDALLNDNAIFVTYSSYSDDILWRRNLLERKRQSQKNDPVTRVEFSIESQNSSIAVGVVSCGEEGDLSAFYGIEQHLSNSLAEVRVELAAFIGGVIWEVSVEEDELDDDPNIIWDFGSDDDDDYDADDDGGMFWEVDSDEEAGDEEEEEEIEENIDDEESDSLDGLRRIFHFDFSSKTAGGVIPSLADLGAGLLHTVAKNGSSSPPPLNKITRADKTKAVIIQPFGGEGGAALLFWDGATQVVISLFGENDALVDSFVDTFTGFWNPRPSVVFWDDIPTASTFD